MLLRRYHALLVFYFLSYINTSSALRGKIVKPSAGKLGDTLDEDNISTGRGLIDSKAKLAKNGKKTVHKRSKGGKSGGTSKPKEKKKGGKNGKNKERKGGDSGALLSVSECTPSSVVIIENDDGAKLLPSESSSDSCVSSGRNQFVCHPSDHDRLSFSFSGGETKASIVSPAGLSTQEKTRRATSAGESSCLYHFSCLRDDEAVAGSSHRSAVKLLEASSSDQETIFFKCDIPVEESSPFSMFYKIDNFRLPLPSEFEAVRQLTEDFLNESGGPYTVILDEVDIKLGEPVGMKFKVTGIVPTGTTPEGFAEMILDVLSENNFAEYLRRLQALPSPNIFLTTSEVTGETFGPPTSFPSAAPSTTVPTLRPGTELESSSFKLFYNFDQSQIPIPEDDEEVRQLTEDFLNESSGGPYTVLLDDTSFFFAEEYEMEFRAKGVVPAGTTAEAFAEMILDVLGENDFAEYLTRVQGLPTSNVLHTTSAISGEIVGRMRVLRLQTKLP